MSINDNPLLEKLAFVIQKRGFEALQCLDKEELVKPLIFCDWQRTGGKLGYKALADRYGLSVGVVRRICREIEERVQKPSTLK